jgi:LysR family transcriptional regulator, regulator for genes of the gallate degradation pathway
MLREVIRFCYIARARRFQQSRPPMALLDVPSLRQLRAFEAVARLESVSSAAREVNLSQPALTQSLHALEARLRTRLFERRRSGCYPTELGVALLPRVRRFFDHIRSALAEPAVGAPFAGRQNADAIINKLTRPQLRSLIAISENQSFEAAARWLGIAQPSLHRSARELERELRRNLYQRTASGMSTSAQGSELARRFQLAIREIEYGLEEIQAAKGVVVSRLAIGNIPHSNNQVLSAAINGLLSAHPNAHVHVADGHYEALLHDLRAGKLDFLFGVLRRPEWAFDVKEELLFPNPYVVVARRDHPLTSLNTLTLNDLVRYDWVMPGPGTPRQQAFEQMFRAMPTRARVSIETTSMQIYRTILASTDRLTLMSGAEAQLNDDRAFVVLPFQSPHLRRVDGVATRLDWRPTSIHQQFLDLLRAQARALSAFSRDRSGQGSTGTRPGPWGTKSTRRKPAARRLRRLRAL